MEGSDHDEEDKSHHGCELDRHLLGGSQKAGLLISKFDEHACQVKEDYAEEHVEKTF